mgnify:CR=1 FL=1
MTLPGGVSLDYLGIQWVESETTPGDAITLIHQVLEFLSRSL